MGHWLRRHKNQIYRFLIGCTMVCLTLLVWMTVNLYRQRKTTEAMIAARNQEAAQMSQSETISSEAVSLEDGTLIWNGKHYRRNTYMKAVLCMGVDRSGTMEGYQTAGSGGQADGIFLVAQDTARGTVKLLMIPRDTMTNIILTDLSGNVLGKNIQHLTLAYAYGDGREKSCEYMREAVSELLIGLTIDHYMAADMDVINILNDAVGGVTVTVPTDGMEQKDPAFVKGSTLTLKGEQAEAFVRYRDITRSHSALYRMDQQQEYLEGFFRAVKDSKGSDSQVISHLFELIEEHMVTDMAKDEYLDMALDALNTDGLTSEDIYTLPGMGVTTARYDEFYPDQNALMPILLELFYREVK